MSDVNLQIYHLMHEKNVGSKIVNISLSIICNLYISQSKIYLEI